MSRLYRQD